MLNPGRFWVRGKIIDPRSNTEVEVRKIVTAASAQEAAAKRTVLLEEAVRRTHTERMTVGAFAKSWIESKEGRVASSTLEGYVIALEHHVLPGLGAFFYDAVGHLEVQSWVNACLRKKKPDGATYALDSVRDWFRVLRNMTHDAVVELKLDRDPTLRISLESVARGGDGELNVGDDEVDGDGPASRRLTLAECRALLEVMEQKFPGSHAICKTASCTGQRFCHVSALQWRDLDFEAGVIRFRRKQVRGVVGPITKKKPAPREVPMIPALVETLQAHRQRLARLEYPVSDTDWVFPSRNDKLKTPASLTKAIRESTKAAGIRKRITPHKLRYFFNDLLRLAGVDQVTRKALTGHVTDDMQEHYSTVDLDEKRAAMKAVAKRLDDEKVALWVAPRSKKTKAA